MLAEFSASHPGVRWPCAGLIPCRYAYETCPALLDCKFGGANMPGRNRVSGGPAGAGQEDRRHDHQMASVLFAGKK